MAYDLGIDLGSDDTSAAIRFEDGTAEVIWLTSPEELRVSPVPSPTVGQLLDVVEAVIQQVAGRQRAMPRATVVTHPEQWDDHLLGQLDQALSLTVTRPIGRLTESYAAAQTARVPGSRATGRNAVALGGAVAASDWASTSTPTAPAAESGGVGARTATATAVASRPATDTPNRADARMTVNAGTADTAAVHLRGGGSSGHAGNGGGRPSSEPPTSPTRRRPPPPAVPPPSRGLGRGNSRRSIAIALGAAFVFAVGVGFAYSRSTADERAVSPVAAEGSATTVASAGEVPIEPGVTPAETAASVSSTAPASFVGVPLTTVPGMAAVPAGNYVVGSPTSGTTTEYSPERTLALNAYFLDLLEVTNADYLRFLQVFAPLGVTAPESWGDDGVINDGEERRPATGVPWEYADAFCRAQGKRLPSEAEWEVAASAQPSTGARQLYPWGDDEAGFTPPTDNDSTYDAGTQPTNMSPLGVFDLAGNAWEYVGDSYDETVSGVPGMRVVRGGTNSFLLESSARKAADPVQYYMAKWVGFRCAISADAPPPSSTFNLVEVTEPPAEAPHAIPGPGEIDDNFRDPTFRPWPSKKTENAVWGYHPLDTFHLGTKGDDIVALATKAVEIEAEEARYRVTAAGGIIPARTDSADGFCLGLGVNVDNEGRGLFFAACPTEDPNEATIRFFVMADGNVQAPIYPERNVVISRDAMVELRIDILDRDRFRFFLNGEQVGRDAEDALSRVLGPDFDGRNVAMYLRSSPENSTKVHAHFHQFTVEKLDE